MITAGMTEQESVSQPNGSIGRSLKARMGRLGNSARAIAHTTGRWAREHTNWFWLALAVFLGLMYLYALLASSSPMWH